MGFFDRLRRLVPGRPPTPFARGVRALDRGRLDEAEAAFAQAALAADAAQLALIANKLAIVAIHRGRRDLAVAQLVRALELNPRSPAAITTVGNLLLEDGDADEAVAHYEAAIRIDDAYGPAYHNLGVALHRAGRRGAAVRNLRKASRLEGRKRRP
ncbi:MAG TPA: tetratricopeptide repeat protein [Candidatus Sulfotelmatobacter sp.]|nr:tetratricopeptide repeat protein [Candidatus Sulfotelmatobacter sp.]